MGTRTVGPEVTEGRAGSKRERERWPEFCVTQKVQHMGEGRREEAKRILKPKTPPLAYAAAKPCIRASAEHYECSCRSYAK